MLKLLAIGNDIRAGQNVECRAKPLARLASGMSWSTSGTTLPQVPAQLDGMAVGLVDRFMAHRDRMVFQAHTAGDLLRRPAVYDPSIISYLTCQKRASFRSLARSSYAMSCSVTQ